MPTLSWRHHTLIQALLSRGPLKEPDFRSIFSHVTGKSAGSHQQLFNDYLLKINEELAYVRLELRACRDQYDDSVYYGVVNNVSDEQSKLGTKYSVPQIAFYKGIIEAIIQDTAAQGSISNIEALNVRLEYQVPTGTESESQGASTYIPHALRSFNMSQKEKTLEELVKDKWLCLTSDGTIGLGVRSFLDLRSWFRTNEVPSCEVCNESAVKAEFCKNESCNVRIHLYCLKKKFSQRTVNRVCSSCGTQWDFIEKTKAEYVEEEEEPNGPTQNTQTQTQTSGRKRGRRSTQEVVKEEDTSGPTQSQPTERKRRRTRQVVDEDNTSNLTSTSITEPRRSTRRSGRTGTN